MKKIKLLIIFLSFSLMLSAVEANNSPISMKVAPSGHLIVDVTINGKFTQPFIIDTGANSVTIPSDLFEKLNVPESGITNVKEYGGNGVYNVKSFILSSVSVGTSEVKGLEGTVSENAIVLPGFDGVNMGVLPNNFLQHFLTEIDLSAKEVIFHDKKTHPVSLYPNRDFTELPLKISEGGFIDLDVQLNGLTITSHFDTGAGNTLFVNWNAANKIGFKKGGNDLSLLGQGMGTDGKPFDIYGATQKSPFTLGGIEFNAKLLVADMAIFDVMGKGPRGNLGVGIFNDRKLFINYENQRIYFSKESG